MRVAPASPASAPARLRAVDALRGTAMLLVCLSHFADGYLRPLGEETARLRQALTALTFVASPAFVLVSGLMLGLLHARCRDDFGRVRRALQRRGLLLLTLGHLAILPTFLPVVDAPADLVRVLLMTDTLGVLLLVGPLLVPRLPARARLGVAALAFAADWALVVGWTPHQALLRGVQAALAGPAGEGGPVRYTFPLLAWAALYLAATVLGGWLEERARPARMHEVAPGLLRLGARVGAAGAGLLLLYAAARAAGADGLRHFLSPLQKLPPGPTYLALYGALTLALLAALVAAEQRRVLGPSLAWSARLGRHSLALFIGQFYVYYGALPLLHLGYTPAWPLLFALTLVPVVGLAVLLDARAASPGPARLSGGGLAPPT